MAYDRPLMGTAQEKRRYTNVNARTARLVRNALTWSPFLEGTAISVAAESGVITLTGTTPYNALARTAMMIAYTIPGVHHVINNIGVAAASVDSSDAADTIAAIA